MDAVTFTLWRTRMGWTQRQAAPRLGLSRRTVQLYEAGDQAVPLAVELACAALLLSPDPVLELERELADGGSAAGDD